LPIALPKREDLTFGEIVSALSERNIQLALKYYF